MQIDFHHAVTYVVARWSGFDHARAATIAHAAQYVDDATNDGPIRFRDGRMFYRVATAHRMLDPKNLSDFQNHLAWVPFHFLPNGEETGGDRLICRPNSRLAQEMLACCIADCHAADGKLADNALHRLGITAHTYVDTWAHQGFMGVLDPLNMVKALRTRNDDLDPDWWDAVKQIFSHIPLIRDKLPPLGHGQALSEPDLPWLQWAYVNGEDTLVKRKNLDLFVEAADHLAVFFRRFLANDHQADVKGLSDTQKDQLRKKFNALRDQDGEQRHAAWLAAITGGAFDDIPAETRIPYIPKGPGSWKDQALGNVDDSEDPKDRPEYTADFLVSDWKRFHDAANAHLRTVTAHLFPQFGLVIP